MKKLTLLLALSLLVMAPVGLMAQKKKSKKSPLVTHTDSVSYAIGLDIAKNFKAQEIPISSEALARAMEDYAKGGDKVLMNEEVQMQVIRNFQMEMQNKAMAGEMAAAQENLVKGETFLDENKTKPGVIELPSGMQYKVLQDGTGASPTLEDQVTIHYVGKLIDGTVFDSSVNRGEPATFPLQNLIVGWQEALPMMKEGAKWILYIPSDMAYGEQAPPSIGPNQVLVFEIELIKVPK